MQQDKAPICQRCHLLMRTDQGLAQHMQVCKTKSKKISPVPFKPPAPVPTETCDRCCETFPRTHIEKHMKKCARLCQWCNKKLANKDDCNAHQVVVSSDTLYKVSLKFCALCSVFYSTHFFYSVTDILNTHVLLQ